MLRYGFVIVGGPYDGVEGMKWDDDGEHPTPTVILVGRCEKGDDCGAQSCTKKTAHVSFWLPDEKARPVKLVRYEKQRDEVVRGEKPPHELTGRTTYAIGGLLDPRNFGALAHEPAGMVPPLTYAGSINAPSSPFWPDYEMEPRAAHSMCRCVLVPACPVCRRPKGSLHTPTCPFRVTGR